ncbi:unnamed protein product [Soboliphyme baturini]|uniref:Transposase n=1 Tax=Soboliphyme baturini TaxID=241478 RepID=A0A183IKQ9_9BILA|nr:unnamed protein product [Soboliphyme baturini]
MLCTIKRVGFRLVWQKAKTDHRSGIIRIFKNRPQVVTHISTCCFIVAKAVDWHVVVVTSLGTGDLALYQDTEDCSHHAVYSCLNRMPERIHFAQMKHYGVAQLRLRDITLMRMIQKE